MAPESGAIFVPTVSSVISVKYGKIVSEIKETYHELAK
jgi:hypothetical protein